MAPFKLDADGEVIQLMGLSDTLDWVPVQTIPLPPIPEGESWGLSRTGDSGFFTTPSPGTTNPDVSRIGYAKENFQIQPPSGFREETNLECHLSVQVPSPGVTVYYTRDGSSPDPTSSQIWPASGIRISESQVLRFGFYKNGEEVAPQQSRTYLHHKSLFKKSEGHFAPEGWPESWGRNALYYGPSQSHIASWGWDADLKEAFLSIPTYSLILPLEDLFHEEHGIYANAAMKGRDWERHCLLEYLPQKWGSTIRGECRGAHPGVGFPAATGTPKHSLRFFFRGEYGDAKLRYPLFGMDAAQEFDHLDLRTSQNYSWSFGSDPNANFIRDQFNRDLQKMMGQPCVRGDFCHLFINGLYWGLYNSSERPEASYGAGYLGGKKENYDVIKSAGFDWGARYAATRDDRPTGPSGATMHIEATDGDMDAWKQLWDLTQLPGGFANDSNYFMAVGCNPQGERDKKSPVLLDATNLADYMLIILGMGNRDSPLTSGGDRPNNWYAIRHKKGNQGFQFFIWDAEHSLLSPYDDRSGPWRTGELFEFSNPQYLWEKCLMNPEFRFLVKDRVHKHLRPGGALSTDRLRDHLRTRALEIRKAVVAESARWGSIVAFDPQPYNILNRDDHWIPAISHLDHQYLTQRSAVFYGQLQAGGLTHLLPEPVANLNNDATEWIVSIPPQFHKSATLMWTESLDGPRVAKGGVHPKAHTSTQSVSFPVDREFSARLRVGAVWGPELQSSGLPNVQAMRNGSGLDR
ncbi:MAG: CotH kinase family protein [Verrucomicrobia bacterium]|nr:CotH kinase family protein [Verrucomicrobiota bacterium]